VSFILVPKYLHWCTCSMEKCGQFKSSLLVCILIIVCLCFSFSHLRWNSRF